MTVFASAGHRVAAPVDPDPPPQPDSADEPIRPPLRPDYPSPDIPHPEPPKPDEGSLLRRVLAGTRGLGPDWD